MNVGTIVLNSNLFALILLALVPIPKIKGEAQWYWIARWFAFVNIWMWYTTRAQPGIVHSIVDTIFMIAYFFLTEQLYQKWKVRK
jgi:hypothetical protein